MTKDEWMQIWRLGLMGSAHMELAKRTMGKSEPGRWQFLCEGVTIRMFREAHWIVFEELSTSGNPELVDFLAQVTKMDYATAVDVGLRVVIALEESKKGQDDEN